jgi:hypothetical protein
MRVKNKKMFQGLSKIFLTATFLSLACAAEKSNKWGRMWILWLNINTFNDVLPFPCYHVNKNGLTLLLLSKSMKDHNVEDGFQHWYFKLFMDFSEKFFLCKKFDKFSIEKFCWIIFTQFQKINPRFCWSKIMRKNYAIHKK